MYETLEWNFFDIDKELAELWVNADDVNSLQEEVDRYGQSSNLVAYIENLKASLVDGEKRCKKVSKDEAKSCWAFKAVQKVLQQKKDDCASALKGLEEEVAVARREFWESLRQEIEAVSRVQDEMLEQEQGFCPDLTITFDQLDPLTYASGKDTESGHRASELGTDI